VAVVVGKQATRGALPQDVPDCMRTAPANRPAPDLLIDLRHGSWRGKRGKRGFDLAIAYHIAGAYDHQDDFPTCGIGMDATDAGFAT